MKAVQLSTKQGRGIVRNKGQMIVTRVLKAADAYYKEYNRTNDLNYLSKATDIYAELLPYIMPKLQSVDMTMDSQVTIDVAQIKAYYERIIDSRAEFMELPEGPAPVDTPALTDTPTSDTILAPDNNTDPDL